MGDFTSTLLSRPVNISRYAAIYASGGKNLGPSGFVVVIVKKDLIGPEAASPRTPSVLNWHLHAASQPIPSIYNTPPVLPIYLHSLVLADLKARGGLDAVKERVERRARLIFHEVDISEGYYIMKVQDNDHRSRMNVPLVIGDGAARRRDLEEKFVRDATAKDMHQLFGHPVRGGLR